MQAPRGRPRRQPRARPQPPLRARRRWAQQKSEPARRAQISRRPRQPATPICRSSARARKPRNGWIA